MRKLFALTAIAALMTMASAHAATPSTQAETSYDAKDNGGYVAKDKMESTDSAGTTTEREATKKVTVDSNGNKETTLDAKTTTDPKGLFNKTSAETKNSAEIKDGKKVYKHKKKVNGKTVEDTSETESH